MSDIQLIIPSVNFFIVACPKTGINLFYPLLDHHVPDFLMAISGKSQSWNQTWLPRKPTDKKNIHL